MDDRAYVKPSKTARTARLRDKHFQAGAGVVAVGSRDGGNTGLIRAADERDLTLEGFVESLATQTVVIFAIRMRRSPFTRSRFSRRTRLPKPPAAEGIRR